MLYTVTQGIYTLNKYTNFLIVRKSKQINDQTNSICTFIYRNTLSKFVQQHDLRLAENHGDIMDAYITFHDLSSYASHYHNNDGSYTKSYTIEGICMRTATEE